MRIVEKALLTEEEFLACVRDALARSPSAATSRLRVGIGDDAAVWKSRGAHLELITTDTLVDGVHFRLHDSRPGQLGHKALAKNLSDIAAMAGRPTLAVIALGVTDEIDEPWVREFYAGLAAPAARYHCSIAGGDIVKAPALTIGVTVVGDVRRTHLRLRSGARAGDVAAVTGPLGLGAAGLRAIDLGVLGKMSTKGARAISDAYLTPTPRIGEGSFLGSRRACHALMDISDGLSTDLRAMAVASKVDAIVVRSNLEPDAALAEAARLVNVDSMDLMLNGGDDYELLAAIGARAFRHVARSFATRFGRALVPVGRFTAGDGRVWIEDAATREPLPPGGWNHLKRG